MDLAGRHDDRDHLIATGLTLLAFALRVIALDDRPLTVDEFGAVKTAAFDSTLSIATQYETTNHVLVQILARWAGLIDYSLFFLRWPALWFGVLAVPLTYRLGRAYLGSQPGLIAALLLAIAPVHLGYSQEVRGYSALTFGSVVLFYCAWRIVLDNGWRYWLGFTAAALLTPYAHLFGAMPVAISGLLIGHGLWRRGLWRSAAFRAKIAVSGSLFLAGTGLLFAPLAARIVQLPSVEGWSGEVGPLWRAGRWDRSALNDYGELFLALSPRGEVNSPSSWLFLFLALLGAINLVRRRATASGWLLAWLVGPVALTLLAHLIYPGFYAYRRFYLFALPSYCVLIGQAVVGLGNLPGRYLAGGIARIVGYLWLAGVTAWLLVSFGGLWWQAYQADLDSRWRATARYLGQAAPQDRIVCEAYGRWGAIRAAHRDECYRELSIRLGAVQGDLGPAALPALNLEVDELATIQNVEAYPDLAFGPGGVWLVLWRSEPPTQSPVLPALPVSGRLTQFGSTVVLDSRDRPTLIENLADGLETLVELDNQAGDMFLYYLGLAQLRAALGQTEAAQAALATAESISPAGLNATERVRLTREAIQREAGNQQ